MISNEMDPLVVNSGAAALDLIARQSSTLDMILMDITLGDMEGFDVIQTIRRNGVTTPVIIISGRNEDYDFMYGLSLGADDYVTKPSAPRSWCKGQGLIRRSKSFSQENNQQISCGPFLCDTTTMRFYKNNVELNLSEKERSLLLLFVRHPQQVFTKDMIYEQIWATSSLWTTTPSWSTSTACAARSRTTPAHPSTSSPSAASAIVSCRKSVIYFFIETKKSSQLRAVQSAALWFYAGIKHKTLKKENRMKFVCIFSRKSGVRRAKESP